MQAAVQADDRVLAQRIPDAGGGVQAGTHDVYEEFFHHAVHFLEVAGGDGGIQRQLPAPAQTLVIQPGLRDLRPGVDGGGEAIAQAALCRGVQAEDGVGGDLLEGGDVLLEFIGQFAQRAVFDGGRYIHVGYAVLVHQEVALAFQVKGGKAQVEAVDDGFQFSGITLREQGVGIQMDG